MAHPVDRHTAHAHEQTDTRLHEKQTCDLAPLGGDDQDDARRIFFDVNTPSFFHHLSSFSSWRLADDTEHLVRLNNAVLIRVKLLQMV